MRHDGIEAVAVKKKKSRQEQATKNSEEDFARPKKIITWSHYTYGVVHPQPQTRPRKKRAEELADLVYVCFCGFMSNLLASPLPYLFSLPGSILKGKWGAPSSAAHGAAREDRAVSCLHVVVVVVVIGRPGVVYSLSPAQPKSATSASPTTLHWLLLLSLLFLFLGCPWACSKRCEYACKTPPARSPNSIREEREAEVCVCPSPPCCFCLCAFASFPGGANERV